MSVVLAPEIESRLSERAATAGISEDELANALIATALDIQGLASEDEIEAIREAIQAGQEGRERPFSEFIAEHRARYPDQPK